MPLAGAAARLTGANPADQSRSGGFATSGDSARTWPETKRSRPTTRSPAHEASVKAKSARDRRTYAAPRVGSNSRSTTRRSPRQACTGPRPASSRRRAYGARSARSSTRRCATAAPGICSTLCPDSAISVDAARRARDRLRPLQGLHGVRRRLPAARHSRHSEQGAGSGKGENMSRHCSRETARPPGARGSPMRTTSRRSRSRRRPRSSRRSRLDRGEMAARMVMLESEHSMLTAAGAAPPPACACSPPLRPRASCTPWRCSTPSRAGARRS